MSFDPAAEPAPNIVMANQPAISKITSLGIITYLVFPYAALLKILICAVFKKWKEDKWVGYQFWISLTTEIFIYEQTWGLFT